LLQAVIFESTHNSQKYFIQKLYGLKDLKFQLRNFLHTTGNFQSIISVLELIGSNCLKEEKVLI